MHVGGLKNGGGSPVPLSSLDRPQKDPQRHDDLPPTSLYPTPPSSLTSSHPHEAFTRQSEVTAPTSPSDERVDEGEEVSRRSELLRKLSQHRQERRASRHVEVLDALKIIDSLPDD